MILAWDGCLSAISRGEKSVKIDTMRSGNRTLIWTPHDANVPFVTM